MKHYFLINPAAGTGRAEMLAANIADAYMQANAEFELHHTKSSEEARAYVRAITSRGEPCRIYAVGGDGTLCDVLAGVADFERTELGCFPCGTGNDFVKALPGIDATALLDIEAQRTGSTKAVDTLSVSYSGNTVRCLNIVNVGLDATAAYYMQRIKKIPLLGGLSYVLGLAWGVCRPLGIALRVESDSGEVWDESATIAVFANGKCYGGSFWAAPEADVTDGVLDMCLVKKVPHSRFFKLVGQYKKGHHLHNPRFADIITFWRMRTVTFRAPKLLRLCCDGEIFSVPANTDVHLTTEAQQVQFVVPTHI